MTKLTKPLQACSWPWILIAGFDGEMLAGACSCFWVVSCKSPFRSWHATVEQHSLMSHMNPETKHIEQAMLHTDFRRMWVATGDRLKRLSSLNLRARIYVVGLRVAALPSELLVSVRAIDIEHVPCAVMHQ